MRSKLLKLVRHLNQEKKLKRGVKDVVKSIKKGSKGLCVIAADVSPVDVISHIPLLCEDAGIPYIFVVEFYKIWYHNDIDNFSTIMLYQ